MKVLADPTDALEQGLAQLRTEFQVPADFPAEVVAAAEQAARRVPDEHADRTNREFVTLDPATSTDLDQAFAIEVSGGDMLLHYAIADVAWFVRDGDPIDVEAWRRGETLYLPDGKAGLHPPVLAEGAASLLPDGPRPAVVFTVRVSGDGSTRLDAVERALIQNRAKLAYDTVREADLPAGFTELTTRLLAAEVRRGASRVDPPEQEVARTADGFELAFRPRLDSEVRNAALSLATNLAVAETLRLHGTGLFRVMAEPDARAISRLRHTAKALGVVWPAETTLDRFEATLNGDDAKQAALMLAIRRAGPAASYAPFESGVVPWHAAMAATYAQATAPLRRLADRYVVQAALSVANGRAVPPEVTAAFVRLPSVMARADAQAGRIDRAVIDLAEATLLAGKAGHEFAAVVVEADEHGAKVQLRDQPVLARVPGALLSPGDVLRLRLTVADPLRRTISFALLS